MAFLNTFTGKSFLMNFSEQQIVDLVKKYYGLTVKAKALTGEYEFNYLLSAEDGKKYIFKIASDEDSYDFFDAQVKILHHLSKSEVADKFYKYLPNTEGKELMELMIDEKKYLEQHSKAWFIQLATNQSINWVHRNGNIYIRKNEASENGKEIGETRIWKRRSKIRTIQ